MLLGTQNLLELLGCSRYSLGITSLDTFLVTLLGFLEALVTFSRSTLGISSLVTYLVTFLDFLEVLVTFVVAKILLEITSLVFLT